MQLVIVNVIILVLSLAIILISCELFVNGIEWLGRKMKVGDGVVGSLFSAVGTCLPETSIPVIAILFSKETEKANDISIGAIVGAPFMLSTLAFFMAGLSVVIFSKKRKNGFELRVNTRILNRDLSFFITVYSIGVITTFITNIKVRYFISALLIVYYIYYVGLTIREDRQNQGIPERLYIRRFLDLRSNKAAILFQIAVSLFGIIVGAELFVQKIGYISSEIGISALVLSLIITPVATELPEKFNSIIWIRKRKDTLALGNITGAMVFQSCIPVSLGIVATSWKLDIKVLVSAVLAIISTLTSIIWIKLKGKLNVTPLLTGGVFYIVFIFYLVFSEFK